MTRTLATVALTIAFGLGTTTTFAQDRKDLQLFKDVATQVERYVRYTIFDSIDAAVEDGAVTLSGQVTMPYKAKEIAARVAKVPGVKSVRNDIQTLPVSLFDDELRYRAARAIYGNLSFVQFANVANPPIHIVVDRGRLTLTGVVNSNVDRMLARSLVTSLGALSVVNELRTDAEVRALLETMN
ncbi:MAG: BON domain-containing protein [Vicinamibacterales bacterium]